MRSRKIRLPRSVGFPPFDFRDPSLSPQSGLPGDGALAGANALSFFFLSDDFVKFREKAPRWPWSVS